MPKEEKYEPTEGRIEDAGKGKLDDEMLPNKGEPVEQEEAPGGDEYDTAGEHGDMAPETADAIGDKAEEAEREKTK